MSNADMHLFYNSQNRCSLPITLHTSREVPPINVNSNGGWQSAKRQTHEDSVHVPFIVKGLAGMANCHQLAFFDIISTLLGYAGEDVSKYSFEPSTCERCNDGISFYNTLIGNDKEQPKHEVSLLGVSRDQSSVLAHG